MPRAELLPRWMRRPHRVPPSSRVEPVDWDHVDPPAPEPFADPQYSEDASQQ